MKKTITGLMIMNMKKKILKPTMIFHVKKTKISSQMTITIQLRYAENITLDEIEIFIFRKMEREKESPQVLQRNRQKRRNLQNHRKRSRKAAVNQKKNDSLIL